MTACPEHGFYCIGDGCCCADKHQARSAIRRANAAAAGKVADEAPPNDLGTSGRSSEVGRRFLSASTATHGDDE